MWVQGGGFTFQTTSTVTGPVNSVFDSTYLNLFFIRGSNICDCTGKLALVSDGYRIYGRDAKLIDGGDTQAFGQSFGSHGSAGSAYSQTSIFLPAGNGEYYLVLTNASDNEILTYWNASPMVRAHFDEIRYSVIDMKANSGAGKVVRKGVPLMQGADLVKCGMMATRHGNGRGLVARKNSTRYTSNTHVPVYARQRVRPCHAANTSAYLEP